MRLNKYIRVGEKLNATPYHSIQYHRSPHTPYTTTQHSVRQYDTTPCSATGCHTMPPYITTQQHSRIIECNTSQFKKHNKTQCKATSYNVLYALDVIRKQDEFTRYYAIQTVHTTQSTQYNWVQNAIRLDFNTMQHNTIQYDSTPCITTKHDNTTG